MRSRHRFLNERPAGAQHQATRTARMGATWKGSGMRNFETEALESCPSHRWFRLIIAMLPPQDRAEMMTEPGSPREGTAARIGFNKQVRHKSGWQLLLDFGSGRRDAGRPNRPGEVLE